MTHSPSTYGLLPEQGSAQDFLGMLERFGGAGYWTIDLRSKTIFWSEQVCRIHGKPSGYHPESLKEVINYYHPEDRPAVTAAVESSAETGEPFAFTYRLLLEGGELRWVETNGVVHLDENGEPDKIIGTFRDITESVKADRELRDAAQFHDRIMTAINEMQDAFAIFDADDRLFVCNDAYLELYKVSHEIIEPGVLFEDMIRYGVERGQYLDAVGREEEWIAERMEMHRNPPGPIEQRLANGRWLRVQEFIAGDGSRVGFRIDITETKRLEARLTDAAREALSANRLKDRFLANMSHELRTPLNAIIGFSQVLEMMVQQERADGKVAEYARDIGGAGYHLLGIIEDIFSLAQMDADEESLHLEPIHVHKILDDTYSLTGALAREHGKTLIVDHGGCGGFVLTADKTKIMQVMVNLVSNAIKYCGSSRNILISAGFGSDGKVLLKVTDYGPGIPKHLQARIFERFERLDATKQAIEGVGIGLAIARDLVRAMKGEISVDSVEGEGSTFWIALPLDPASAQQAAV